MSHFGLGRLSSFPVSQTPVLPVSFLIGRGVIVEGMQAAEVTNSSFIIANFAGWPGDFIAGGFSALAAIIALISAIYTTWKNNKTSEKIEALKSTTGKEIEVLKDSLARASANEEAQRNYEYEARKRLYTECEPLVMKLSESCDFAASRILFISDPRRWGEYRAIRDPNSFWMLCESSEVISFAHMLLEPLAWRTLLTEKITLVDLSFDKRISEINALARCAYQAHMQDREIARTPPPLSYDPVVPGWRAKRAHEPAKYWWQGATRVRLDPAIELCINREHQRAASISEFEETYRSLYDQPESSQAKSLGIFCNPLYNFRIEDRPVYWRLLLSQLLLYRRIFHVSKLDATLPISPFIAFEPQDVAFMQGANGIKDSDLTASMAAALSYVSSTTGLQAG